MLAMSICAAEDLEKKERGGQEERLSGYLVRIAGSCVVDDDINAAVRGQCLLQHGLPVCSLRNVGFDEGTSEFAGDFLAILHRQIGDDYFGAFLSKRGCDARSVSTPATGNDGYFIPEALRHAW